MNYDAIRHVADSWGLAVMTLVFVALCVWPFLPHSRDANRRAATSILRDEEKHDG